VLILVSVITLAFYAKAAGLGWSNAIHQSPLI
jgi:hypothetical protein